MRKNWAQNIKSGESCGRARSSSVSPHTNERHMLVYLLTFSQAKLYNLCSDEKGNREDRFFRFTFQLLSFLGSISRDRTKSYSPRSRTNKKKRGRKLGRWAGKKGTRVSSRDWQQFHKTFHFSRRRHQNKGDNNFLVRK